MRRYLAYLKAVLRHKWFVFLACLQFGVPLWSAVLHDWDKFLPDEWFAYARTFYKPNGEGQYVESPEFAHAWMLHQHRNKHHWQYWLWVNEIDDNDGVPLRKTNVLMWDRGVAEYVKTQGFENVTWYLECPLNQDCAIAPLPMPNLARREMLADWFGAGRAYDPHWTPLSPRQWYEKNKAKMLLHPDTRAWVEAELQRRETAYLEDLRRRNMLSI